mgnify:FL=1
MDVSVIIVNYNTCELTRACIDSIYSHTSGVEFEVIVVDNASADGSFEVLSQDRRIIFVESGSNLGFGKANNLGYKYSSGKYVFLLNSDTRLLNNALYLFYEEMEKMPNNVACIGSILRASDGITPNGSYALFPTITTMLKFFAGYYFRLKFNRNNHIEPPFEVDYITGADLFIRQHVIEQFGLFDPDFFMYFEETEMQLRYSRCGYKRLIIPGPEIVHLECASSGKGNALSGVRAQMYFEGMMIYMRKRYSSGKYVWFGLISLLYLPLVFVNEKSRKDLCATSKLFFKI